MKKTLNTIFHLSLFIVMALTSSCEDKNDGNVEELMPVELKLSGSDVILREGTALDEALCVSWSRGNSTVSQYIFEMDIKGNDFRGGVYKTHLNTINDTTFTHTELNDLVLEYFPHLNQGTRNEFEIRITALDNLVVKEVSNVAELAVTTYKQSELWIRGNAVAALSGDTRHFTYNASTQKYEWVGELLAYEGFSFGTTPDDAAPSYGKGDEDGKLKYRTSEAEPETEFQVAKEDTYIIEIDIRNLTIKVAQKPIYENIWIVGAVSGWSWDIGMNRSDTDINEFTWTGDFPAGEFKFSVEFIPNNTWGGLFIVAQTAQQQPPLTDYEYIIRYTGSNVDDTKFYIPQEKAGRYSITINLKSGKMNMTKEE